MELNPVDQITVKPLPVELPEKVTTAKQLESNVLRNQRYATRALQVYDLFLESDAISTEEKEKAKIVKKLPDGYPTDVSLDVMRKDLVMHEAQLKAAGKLVAKGPDFEEKDDMLGGEMTDEMYKAASDFEDKIMGDSAGFAAASGGLSEFEYNKITGTHYQAPPELDTKSKK